MASQLLIYDFMKADDTNHGGGHGLGVRELNKIRFVYSYPDTSISSLLSGDHGYAAQTVVSCTPLVSGRVYGLSKGHFGAQ
jgi:hypothetical protein